MRKIPLKKYPDYSFKITIGNTIYVFNVRYNTAFEFWVLSISDNNDNVIASNIRMVINFDLFQEKRGLGLPKGSLYLLDTKATGSEPVYDNILDYDLVYDE